MDDLKKAEQKAVEKRTSEITGGVVLIGIGSIFLISQFTDFSFDNWWALFILIPVVVGWGSAFKQVQAAGRITNGAARTFTGALFPLFIALIFLLDWDWGQVWPGFIIIAGLNAMASGWGR